MAKQRQNIFSNGNCESRYINHFHIHSYDVILNRIMGGILNFLK